MGQSSRSGTRIAGSVLLAHGHWASLELTVDILLGASEVNGLDTTSLLLDGGGEGRAGDSSGRAGRSTQSRHEGAALGSRLQLAGQRPHGAGETSGRHLGWVWRGDWVDWREENEEGESQESGHLTKVMGFSWSMLLRSTHRAGSFHSKFLTLQACQVSEFGAPAWDVGPRPSSASLRCGWGPTGAPQPGERGVLSIWGTGVQFLPMSLSSFVRGLHARFRRPAAIISRDGSLWS